MGCCPKIFSGYMSKRLFDVFESLLKYQKFKSVYHKWSKSVLDIMQYFSRYMNDDFVIEFDAENNGYITAFIKI